MNEHDLGWYRPTEAHPFVAGLMRLLTALDEVIYAQRAEVHELACFKSTLGIELERVWNRLNVMSLHLEIRIDQLHATIMDGSRRIGARLDRIGASLDSIGASFDRMEAMLGRVNATRGRIEIRLDRIGALLDSIGASFDRMEATLDGMEARCRRMEDRLAHMLDEDGAGPLALARHISDQLERRAAAQATTAQATTAQA